MYVVHSRPPRQKKGRSSSITYSTQPNRCWRALIDVTGAGCTRDDECHMSLTLHFTSQQRDGWMERQAQGVHRRQGAFLQDRGRAMPAATIIILRSHHPPCHFYVLYAKQTDLPWIIVASPAKNVVYAVGLTMYSQAKRGTLGDLCTHAQNPPRNTHNMVHVGTCAWYTCGVKSASAVLYGVPSTITSTKRQAASSQHEPRLLARALPFWAALCNMETRTPLFIRVYKCSKSLPTVQYVYINI